MGLKIVTAEQMREIERQAEAIGFPSPVLMENAGLSVAQEIRGFAGELCRASVLILIGPGNNGGDGLVVARHLHDWGALVTLYIWSRKIDGDPNFRLTQDREIPTLWHRRDDPQALFLQQLAAGADIVVDALLGTGRGRAIEGELQRITTTVQRILNERRTQGDLRPALVAVDLPTGLNADTGELDPAALHANLTVTLGCPKLGLIQFPGATAVGRMVVGSIGSPASLVEDIALELVTAAQVRVMLPGRPLDANKGSFGRLLVVAGSSNYVGAAALSATAATRVGAGLVTLALPASIYPMLAGRLMETTFLPLAEGSVGSIGERATDQLREALPRYDALLVGCGLGRDPETSTFLRTLLGDVVPQWGRPVVIDADALNILSEWPDWPKLLPSGCVLTPHPGELSRLTGESIDALQHDRIGAARRYASAWNACLVLKGAFTVIADWRDQLGINPMANPGMASAGTGDVLAGAISGLLVQGMTPYQAAVCGTYVHGAAGELVRRRVGDTGMVAGDLLPALPEAIRLIRTCAIRELGGFLLER